MGDDIEINVTETTNIIEITPQPNDQIVDIAVTDNAPNVEINVTPSVVEINVTRGSSTAIWGSIEGNLTDQSDLVTALGLKADLIDGKVPSTQLPSYVDDVIEVANYAALPTSGEVGKIYVTLDNNKIYRWSGSLYIEIAANQAIWGAITGNLGDQLDLQNALNTKEPTITAGTTSQYWRGDKSWQTLDKNAVGLGNVDNTSDLNKPISTATQTALDLKFNNPTGDTTQYIAGDGSLITFPISGQAGTIVREVRNTTGATLTKGTIVYISGATGNKATISKAIATGDSTSAQTFGLLQADISNNSNGYVVILGDLIGLDTSGITEGSQLYLSSTVAGAYTTTKQVAPAHLVYIGVVTRSHPSLGQIEVKIQNGYELDEIHDVSITSKANNQFLVYESASNLWKNKSLSTILGGTSSQFLKGDGSLDSTAYVPTARTLTINGTAYDLSANRSWTITAGVWGQITGILSDQTDLQTALDAKTPTARTLTINGTAYDLSANRSWTIPTHDAVTIGTPANGLSLSGQVLSLGLASPTTRGALTSEDYNYFFAKIQGDGNQNYIPKYINSGLGKQIGNSSIFDNGTSVMIGTTGSTGVKVHIVETSTTQGTLLLQNTSASNNATQLQMSLRGTGKLIEGTDATSVLFSVSNGGGGYFKGNTGIGIANPSQKLVVDGGSSDFTPIFAKSSLLSGGKYFGSLLAGYLNDVSKSAQFGYVYDTSNIANSYAHITIFGASEGSQFSMRANGNVGIGITTDAGYKLDVNGTLRVGGSSGGATTPTAITMDGTYRTGGDAFDKLKFYLYKSSTETYGIGLGDLADMQYWAGTTSTGAHRFFTSQTERMRITSDGRVGIGVASVSKTLQVAGESSIASFRLSPKAGTYENYRLDIVTQAADTGAITMSLNDNTFLKTYGYYFLSGLSLGVAGYEDLLHLKNTGKIGIGTTSPSSALQIDSSSWSLNGSTVSRMLQKYIGSAGDYEQHVILLHPIYNGTLVNYNKASGTIYATRGGTSMGLINDTYTFDTASAYNSTAGTVNSQWGYGRLYTCLYNGVKYMALLPDYRTSAVEYNFDGISKSTGEQLKLVTYRYSNSGTVVNSEINNSLTIYTPGTSYFQGDLYTAGIVTASGGFFNSDIRLKEVTDYDYNVSEIKPINYFWKDGRDDKKHVGYSAQEVQKVIPDAVKEDENGMLSVNYIEVLVAKIAQMEKEIELLKSK